MSGVGSGLAIEISYMNNLPSPKTLLPMREEVSDRLLPSRPHILRFFQVN